MIKIVYVLYHECQVLPYCSNNSCRFCAYHNWIHVFIPSQATEFIKTMTSSQRREEKEELHQSNKVQYLFLPHKIDFLNKLALFLLLSILVSHVTDVCSNELRGILIPDSRFSNQKNEVLDKSEIVSIEERKSNWLSPARESRGPNLMKYS